MLIPKKNRMAILNYLFKEGVLVANKDISLPKHMVIEVPNLHVIKLMQSLKSKDYITERYNWGYFYFSLTNKGIEFLREYLHAPSETVPETLRRPDKLAQPPSFGAGRFERDEQQQSKDGAPRGGMRRGRDEYRTSKKEGGAPRDFEPDFVRRGMRGRGRGRGGGGGRGRGRGGRGGGAPQGDGDVQQDS